MQVRAYKAVKADGTRWVPPLKRALDVLLSKNYYTVVSHLQHTSQARDASITMQGRASNYCQKLISFKFLLFLHLLLDIVTAISKLSLQFQEDKISISQLQDKVYALSSTLDSFKLRAGEHPNSFQQEVGDGNLYKGLELTRSECDTASFASSKDEIINQATAFITEKFQGLGDDPVLRFPNFLVFLLLKHSCTFPLMVFLRSIITQLWQLPGGLTQEREQGDQTTMINLYSATLEK